MLGREKGKPVDVHVQGIVAIMAGIIVVAALLLPWLSPDYSAILAMSHTKDSVKLAVPMTLIFLAVLTIFGGAMHILGYRIGIQIATMTSALAFFISVMVIIATLAGVENNEGKTLNLLIGPWIGAAGGVFGALSSKLERK